VTGQPALPFPPDNRLIRDFLAGDEGAFRTLYRRHAPRLRMFVLRMVGYRDAEADDVVQEAWLRACRAMHTFRGDARFDTWLTTIAVRTARARAVPDNAESLDDAMGLALPAPLLSLDDAMDAERVLQRLPDRTRTVFVLYYLEGFTHEEIAQALGVAHGTSRAILSRALSTLRSHYRKDGTNDR